MKNWFSNSRYYIQELFDPIQTHAVYNVPKEEVDTVKKILYQNGATRLRVVRANSKDLRIVCFKYNEKNSKE